MSSFYDLPAGHLGDALDRAMSQAVRRQATAGDAIFSYPGLIQVDWERAASCHHSNVPIVGTIGAMIDPVAAAGALGKIRLASIVGGVSKLDWDQSALLAAAAGWPGAERTLRSHFGRAVLALIEAEDLARYFEFSTPDPDSQDFGIRPAGYAESCRADAEAFASGEDPPPRDIFEEIRQQANVDRLDTPGRVALVAVMALYNEYDTRECFKGRGWLLTARELGDYLRHRAEHRPAAFDSLLLAMATYHGW